MVLGKRNDLLGAELYAVGAPLAQLSVYDYFSLHDFLISDEKFATLPVNTAVVKRFCHERHTGYAWDFRTTLLKGMNTGVFIRRLFAVLLLRYG